MAAIAVFSEIRKNQARKPEVDTWSPHSTDFNLAHAP
jgi:hypothetical protein